MKAVQINRYGPPDVLVYTELPTPSPGPGQVLIQVDAAAVNYADVSYPRLKLLGFTLARRG